jgi:hypothetical protein
LNPFYALINDEASKPNGVAGVQQKVTRRLICRCLLGIHRLINSAMQQGSYTLTILEFEYFLKLYPG